MLCNFWSRFVTFAQVLYRLVKFYNDWSSRPLSSGTPVIFKVRGQKYRDLWLKSTEIAIHRRNLKKIAIWRGKRQISRFVAETSKYRDSAPTATNICPCFGHRLKMVKNTNLSHLDTENIHKWQGCQNVRFCPFYGDLRLFLSLSGNGQKFSPVSSISEFASLSCLPILTYSPGLELRQKSTNNLM